ncbi:hypothetical protein ACFVXG_37540 [Kitasatospora sp. NPDC058162]|uniref:hypothetical protein n=1 Tax=Kitasatospora sp. NPDC058162 TaxID=3346362 RepID=UPI0036DF3677
MMPDHTPLTALRADADGETLDALVRSSRQLRRFWPLVTAGPEPAAPASVGVLVPSGAQRLVAGMAEYGM